MVDILIQGAADLKPVMTQFNALRTQVQMLNDELRQTAISSTNVNPKGYMQMQTALRNSSANWRAAAASTGKFNTEQLRLKSATDTFTESLIKQKLSFADIGKQWKVAKAAYQEQIRLQQMFVRQSSSMSKSGKGLFDIAIPTEASSELNTFGQKLNWVNALVKSGSTQLINWGKNVQWAGRQLMVGFTVPTAAFGVAAGAMAYQVDQQLTRITKVYDTTSVAIIGDSSSMAAANKELGQVTAAAMQTAERAASQYGATATDTLSVQADLAATGLKGAELQKSTAEVMRIATLGELDYNEATTATIALQSAFKLSAQGLGEAFNFMNATENATSLSIQDIIEATPRAASAMAALGVNVEQMTVLLTSMKESGVDAAEAANALKSATGSILAPSPAADEFIQQISKGTVQVSQLAQASGGNLYTALGMLYKQMEGLSELQKQQILVKLFGKYQFNRVSAMVTNLGQAFEYQAGQAGVAGNQTAKAMELMASSTGDLANTAELELNRFQESASGKFKIAVAEVKTQLAEMGKPFLEVGSVIVGFVGKFAKFFNQMPSWTKNAAALAVIGLALVGPFVMLVGLTANLLGTFIKFTNWLAVGGKAMGVVTKETAAMKLASEAAKNGWSQETTAVMQLTKQLEALTMAEETARDAANAGSVHGVSDRVGMYEAQYLEQKQLTAEQRTQQQAQISSQTEILNQLKQQYITEKEMAIQKNIADKEAAIRSARLHQQIMAQYEAEFMAAQRLSNGQYYGMNAKGNKSFITEAQARSNAQAAAATAMLTHEETVAINEQRAAQEQLAAQIMAIIGYKEVSGKVGVEVTTAEKALIQEEAMAYDALSGAVERLTLYRNQDVLAVEAEAAAVAELEAIQDRAAIDKYRSDRARGAQLVEAEAFALAKVAEEQALLTTATEGETVARGKNYSMLGVSGVSMAAMAVSMVAMTATSNETAQNIAKWTMIGSVVLPAAQGLISVMSGVAAKGAEVIAAMKASSLAAGGLSAGLRTGAASMLSMVNPMALVVTGIAAAGYGIYKWREHEKEITAEKVAQVKAMTQQNALLQDALDIQFEAQKKLSVVSGGDTAPGEITASELETKLRADSGSKDLINSVKSTDGLKSQIAVQQQYVSVLNATGGTAEKARTYVEALYRAAGVGALAAMTKSQELYDSLGDNISQSESSAMIVDQIMNSIGKTSGEIAESGRAIGMQIENSIVDGAKGSGDTIAANLEDSLNTSWQKAFDKDLDGPTKKALAKYGYTTGQQLRETINAYTDFSKGNISEKQFQGILPDGTSIEDAITMMQMLADQGTKFNADTSGLLGSEKELVNYLAKSLGIQEDINSLAQLRQTWEWKVANASSATVKSLYDQRVAYENNNKNLGGIFGLHNQISDTEKLEIANLLLANANMGHANTLAEAQAMLMGQVAANAGEAATAAGDIGNKLQMSLKASDMKGIMKTAMTNLTSNMAQGAQDQFQNRMDNAIDAAQTSWDNAEKRLSDKQENAEVAFDKRWDARKDRITDYYDNRIKKVDDTIKAEQKAEDIRKKIFEAEQNRISRSAAMANNNIDMNMAINTGNLDEAAKLQNDMQATMQGWVIDDAKAALEDQTAAKTDRLNNRKDELGQQKDDALQAFQDQEDDAKRHFKKMQEMETDALKRKADADMKARKAAWEADKVSFNQRLDLFKSFTGRNMNDLQAWMKQAGLSYSDFGDNSLKPMGLSWSKYFREKLHEQIRLAGADVASDKMWSEMTMKESRAMLRGWGFKNMNELSQFVQTGKMPDHTAESSGSTANTGTDHQAQQPTVKRHGGGFVGSGKDNRDGRRGSLRTDEAMVLAKKKEFVVNDKSAQANAGLLNRINNSPGPLDGTGGAGTGIGPAGLGSAIMGSMFAAGVAKAVKRTYKKAKREKAQTFMGGSFASGLAGKYGDDGIAFDSEQLGNAATIASVGSKMGMSKRDIEIGIMTAMTESMLRNVNYGDRDSLGLFQQRPSMGWGTVAQVTDPTYAATKFFTALKGVADRDSLSPWMAAQTVQRSGTTDGSNYQQYWDEAMDVFTRGLSQVGGADGGYVAGSGGMHRPVNGGVITQGIHDTNVGFGAAVDIAVPVGTPAYAVGDGTITESKDITGKEPRRVTYGSHSEDGYRSYGKVMVLQLAGGNSVLYGHMSSRAVEAGTKVQGGAQIGKTGNTGYVYSTRGDGAHLHFASKDGNPLQYLKTGGETKGEGLAYLHDKETVLTKPLTEKLKQTVTLFPDLAEGFKTKNSLVNAVLSAFDPRVPGSEMYFANALLGMDKKKKSDTTDTSTDTGDAGTVRTGTYNVDWKSKPETTPGALNKLMGLADVLALQEVYTDRLPLVQKTLKDNNWAMSKYKNDSIVAYNTGKYKMLDSGNQGMNPNTNGGGTQRNRNAAWALLQAQNGQKFYQLSAHTNPMFGQKTKGGKNWDIQREQYGTLGNMVTEFQKKAPVLLGGDLNWELSRPGGIPIGNLTSVMEGHDQTGWNGLHTHSGGGDVDHIMYGPGSKMVKTQIVGGLPSDHNALLSEIKLPSLKVGGLTISDGMANLHEGEAVMTKPLTQDLMNGVKNFANGGTNTYNLNISAGNVSDPQELSRIVIRDLDRREKRKPRSRTE